MKKASLMSLAAAGLMAAAGSMAILGCEEKPAAPAPSGSTPAPKAPEKAPAPKAPEKAPAAPSTGTTTPEKLPPGTISGQKLGGLPVIAMAAAAANSTAAAEKTITIGVIAKSQGNPVFQAARTGAFDAEKDLNAKIKNAKIKVIWQTPVSEDAAKQAQYIEQLVAQGVDGIAVSCTDGEVLKKPIDDAVAKGVTVVTFDSDSPASKRMAYYGINDVEAGREVMRQLAKSMGDKGGTVAILGGNQSAPNLQSRIKGVKEEMEKLKDKGFKLKEVYYHKETPNDAVAMMQQVQTANPDIAGWAMVGGWPLFTQNALAGIYDKAKVVSVDTLPEQLNYVRSGQVQALIGQDCYGWGYQSVVMLVDKIHANKAPAKVINNFDLAIVTKENVEKYAGLWEKWLGTEKKPGEKKDEKPKK